MAIGIKIPNVPQLVPVANASPIAITKNNGGIINIKAASFGTIEATKPPRFKYLSLQIPESVHARQRIKMEGVIALKPVLKQSQKSLKVITFRGRYRKPVNVKAINEPITSDLLASQFAKASAIPTPSKKFPVYSIPKTLAHIKTNNGSIKSITLPLPSPTFDASSVS